VLKNNTKYKLIYILTLVFILIITNGYTVAKYAFNSVWNYYLDSKSFYFSSDSLDTVSIKNVNNNWNLDSTFFSIKNSFNEFQVTEYDIKYDVNCTIKGEEASHASCWLNGKNSSSFSGILSASAKCVNKSLDVDVSGYSQKECESSGYDWVYQENFNELYFDVVPNDGETLDSVTILIEVNTISPYKKVLLGEFKLNAGSFEEDGLNVVYNEFDNYSRVVVSNSYNENKCVKLSWDTSEFKIDNYNSAIINSSVVDNYINQINFNIEKKDSLSFIFYRTDFTKKYGYENFSLVESLDC